MANIKSALKRARISEEANARNASIKTGYRGMIRNFQEILERDPAEAAKIFPQVSASLDQAAQKGVIHRNMAARKKSRLAHALKVKLSQSEAQPEKK